MKRVQTQSDLNNNPPLPQSNSIASTSRIGTPSSIGEFEIIKAIGTGSFGKVKLARHTLLGHKVAMKFISKRKIVSQDMSDRVEREIQYLAMLRHPHIIKLYDVMQTPDNIVMVIEYLGGELFDYIVKTGRMAEAHARRFFQQIIAAVEYCHVNDIVHRDLKPENLLLDAQLNVKIADFGLSNVMKDGDFLKTSCGSPNYAAPEVISGRLYAGPEIDIWSCGVILYVMLAARLPFDDDHIPMLFKKINSGKFSIPPFLSPGARHLVQRMLTVDSNKRITLAEIRQTFWFQQDLPDYLSQPARRIPKDDDVKPDESLSANSSEGEHAPAQAPVEGQEWIPELGWLEMPAVHELAQKNPKEWPEEVVLQALREGLSDPKEATRIRVAYELCADAHRGRLAAERARAERSTGRWAGSDPARSSARKASRDATDDAQTASHTATIGVLPGTIPAPELDPSIQRAMQARNPLMAGRDLQLSRPDPVSTKSSSAKKAKQRWHFGIRSRSPPLEVMLEIHRTLHSLGFEWKKKETKSDASTSTERDDEEDPKKRRQKKDDERIKQAQGLYFVEARCNLGDVTVYMDIQLYQVDENDNYLVDFRNVGYRAVVRQTSPILGSESGTESERGSFSLPHQASQDIRAAMRQMSNANSGTDGMPEVRERPPPPIISSLRATGVSSPFLFLECACRLIVELAGAAHAIRDT